MLLPDFFKRFFKKNRLSKGEYHLYYSHKMMKEIVSQGDKLPIYERIDGTKVAVTIVCNIFGEHGCAWDDMEYMGIGKFSHISTY